MKGRINGKEVGFVVIPELEHLIAQLGAVGFVVIVIAHQFHLFAGLGKHGIIHDENAIIERAAVNDGQDSVDEKGEELSPVESVMVEKPVNGVLLGIEEAAIKFLGP